MSETPGYLTTAEVAARLRVTRREVQRMAASGQIAHLRVGRRIRIREDQLSAFERSHTSRVRSGVMSR